MISQTLPELPTRGNRICKQTLISSYTLLLVRIAITSVIWKSVVTWSGRLWEFKNKEKVQSVNIKSGRCGAGPLTRVIVRRPCMNLKYLFNIGGFSLVKLKERLNSIKGSKKLGGKLDPVSIKLNHYLIR